MKIRSLLLGSVAAAGLSTGAAYAADLGVLTSLDVCDALGLSGLTISSDTNCLQITGEVRYRFNWGDYANPTDLDVDTSDPGPITFDDDNGYNDWRSRFDAWIKFVATADSDFGPAKAVIKLKEVSSKDWKGYGEEGANTVTVTNSGTATIAAGSGTATVVTSTSTATALSYVPVSSSPSTTNGVIMDEAYVSIGDSTVIMAGKKGSILNKGDDAPLNFLGLFNSEAVDTGVGTNPVASGHGPYGVDISDGGHVIQVVSDLGNGISIGAGLEQLNKSDYASAGTAVGVISYAGDGISAHASFEADGVLAGEIQDWSVHAGFAGTFDNFKVVLAGAFDSSDYWNVLASASATFDIFTIAVSGEATALDDYGAGASISAVVTDGVTINLGARYWYDDSDGDDAYEVAAQVVAAVTETLTLTGTVGYADDDHDDLFYGSAKLAWAPGGGYTSSIMGRVNSEGGYKIETEFKKTFQ